MDREAINAWLNALGNLTYYESLGVPRDATADELKGAFHVFADTFHPDAHAARAADEVEAIGRIFRQGAEAYRVLADPALRAVYDASLASGAPPAVASYKSSMPPPRESVGSQRVADAIRTPAARPFVRRAEELAKKGDYKQAKLQLTLARHYEPGNAVLEEYLKELEGKIRGGA